MRDLRRTWPRRTSNRPAPSGASDRRVRGPDSCPADSALAYQWYRWQRRLEKKLVYALIQVARNDRPCAPGQVVAVKLDNRAGLEQAAFNAQGHCVDGEVGILPPRSSDTHTKLLKSWACNRPSS